MAQLGSIIRQGGVTRYHQLYMFLRRAITEGAIASGQALPSEAALMKDYRLSRNTVRRALATLEKEGLIVRRHGSGTYANGDGDSASARRRLSSLAQDGKRFHRETKIRVLHFGFVMTPAHILRHSPEFSPRSLLISRIRSYDGTSFALTTSHVHENAGRGLTRARLASRTVLTRLAELGHTPASGTQTVAAERADLVVARHLEVPDGSPVLRMEGITHNGDGEPIEHHIHVFRPDVFHIEMPLTYDRTALCATVCRGCPPVQYAWTEAPLHCSLANP